MTDDDRVPAGTTVYGSENISVGVDDDGEGFVEFDTAGGDTYRLPVRREAIEDLAIELAEDMPPAPTPPEDVVESVEPVDGWSGGDVRHTGGGIWNRIFSKTTNGYRIEVAYNPEQRDGVAANLYERETGVFLGVIAQTAVDEDADEDVLVEASRNLMREIDAGEYTAELQDLSSDDAGW